MRDLLQVLLMSMRLLGSVVVERVPNHRGLLLRESLLSTEYAFLWNVPRGHRRVKLVRIVVLF